METQAYRERERFRVSLLELRRKFDKMISDLIEKGDEENIQLLKGSSPVALPGPLRIELADDDLPEDLGADTSGGSEKRT